MGLLPTYYHDSTIICSRPGNPQFPFPRFPIWPGIGGGNPPIPDSAGIGKQESPIPDLAGNGNRGPDGAGRGFPGLTIDSVDSERSGKCHYATSGPVLASLMPRLVPPPLARAVFAMGRTPPPPPPRGQVRSIMAVLAFALDPRGRRCSLSGSAVRAAPQWTQPPGSRDSKTQPSRSRWHTGTGRTSPTQQVHSAVARSEVTVRDRRFIDVFLLGRTT